jgi:DNA-binding GntR family transcriptional regulator
MVRVKSSMVAGRHFMALKEHKKILSHMKKRNFPMTEKLLLEHIGKVKSNFLLY